MRNNYKLAGLILFLLLFIGGAVEMWDRHARTDELSASMPATIGASSPIATDAGPDPSTEEHTATVPPAEETGDAAAQSTDGEASKRIGTDRAISMRGAAQPKAAGASKAKEQQESPPVAAQAQGESNNHSDAGTVAEQTPEPAQPPKEMGMLIGRINNSVGSLFRLSKVAFYVDGALVATRDYPSGLQRGVDVQVFERPVDLGNHTLGAVIEYQGNGGGIFSYSEGYHYKVSSSHAFTAAANTTTQVTVVSYEKGSSTTSFENRLGVAFRVGTASGK